MDANNSPLLTSQESNRSRQLKNKFSHCLNFRDEYFWSVWKSFLHVLSRAFRIFLCWSCRDVDNHAVGSVTNCYTVARLVFPEEATIAIDWEFVRK